MLLMTVLTLAPSILVMITSFMRIIVVLSFLDALGLQQTPPNPVLICLALFLTGFVMAPTFEVAYEEGVQPLLEEEIERPRRSSAPAPVHDFMIDHVRERTWSFSSACARASRRRPRIRRSAY